MFLDQADLRNCESYRNRQQAEKLEVDPSRLGCVPPHHFVERSHADEEQYPPYRELVPASVGQLQLFAE